jgi:ATP-dependent protease ClpP protease subunit
MELKYTNFSTENEATMFMYGTIGSDIDGRYFSEEMRYHHEQMGRIVTVYINSPGGNVFDGYSIIQSIIDCEANTHVVGLAASMAGMASQFGIRRSANDFAVMMFHPPQGNGADAELLNIITEKFVMILERCTGKIKEEVVKLFMEGENYYDASQMVSLNLVDDVRSTAVHRKVLTGLDLSQVYNIFNTLINDFDMQKVKAHFKLDEKAGEPEVLTSIEALETTISDNETIVADKELEIQNLQEKLAASDKTIAEMVIASAILDGKIDPDKKDIWVDQAVKDLDGVKNQLDSIKTPDVQASVQTTIVGTGNGKTQDIDGVEDVVDFVRNHEEELNELRGADPKKFDKVMSMYNEKTAK